MATNEDIQSKIRKCADRGLELAQNCEYDKAIPLLTFAAEHGHVYSMANLGHLYELIKDYEKAFYWNKKAADLNNLTGVYNLLIAYEFGKGVEPNGEEAIKLADKLIKYGNIDDGYFKKAMIIKKGVGNLTPDHYKAFQIALEGAKKVMERNPDPKPGFDSDCPLEVGIMYEFGQGVEADRKKAMEYYEYSAKCEHKVGMYNYAQCLNYIDENNIENKKKAFELYKELLKKHYGDANFELAKFYFTDNEVVEKDNRKACRYLASGFRMDSFESHYEDALNKLKELYPEDVDNVLSGQYSRILDSDE